MGKVDVAATVILHFPMETPRTRTVSGVVNAEVEWGSMNTVTLEKVDGTCDSFTSNGLTISGFSLQPRNQQ